jgi:hypothetical protein
MTPEDALRFRVRDNYVVRVRIEGERELIFGDVVVRVNPAFRLAMHIDTDEGNAANIRTGMLGYIEEIQSRLPARRGHADQFVKETLCICFSFKLLEFKCVRRQRDCESYSDQQYANRNICFRRWSRELGHCSRQWKTGVAT